MALSIYHTAAAVAVAAVMTACATAPAPPQHLQRGEELLLHAGAGDLKQAIIAFKAAMDDSPDQTATLARIRDLLFDAAEKQHQAGDDYQESRFYLAYTENFDGACAEAYFRIGRCYERMGNAVGALYFARKAYKLAPEDRRIIELIKRLNPV